MTDRKITMDGEWAYECDPFTQVKIVMVDRPNRRDFPVVSMIQPIGYFVGHSTTGVSAGYGPNYNLIPLQKKPREARTVFIHEHADGSLADVFWSSMNTPTSRCFIEVIEDE